MGLTLTVRTESWAIAGAFTIARGAKTQAEVVVAEVSDGRHRGRGECVPYARYGETIAGVMAAIEAMRAPLGEGLTREALQTVHVLAGLPAPRALVTAYTISLGTPQTMAEAAAQAAGLKLVKVKLGGPGDAARIAAVRAAALNTELIVDANEGWRADNLADNLAACAQAGVTLIEQPLPAGDDAALAKITRPIPVCADESVHDRASLAPLLGKYDAVNIKLDKTGGLTEALALAREAEHLGFSLMVGCMVATSLSMAPAILVAQHARVVDLDGPLLLARDRENGLKYEDSLVYPASSALWG